jgi:hypothetical protein
LAFLYNFARSVAFLPLGAVLIVAIIEFNLNYAAVEFRKSLAQRNVLLTVRNKISKFALAGVYHTLYTHVQAHIGQSKMMSAHNFQTRQQL